MLYYFIYRVYYVLPVVPGYMHLCGTGTVPGIIFAFLLELRGTGTRALTPLYLLWRGTRAQSLRGILGASLGAKINQNWSPHFLPS